MKRVHTLAIKIPAGVDTGSQLRLAGEGEAGVHGGPPGDLYVVIHIKPHPDFERVGNDLHTEIGISFPMAALGGRITVETLDSPEEIHIPAGTQSGTRFRLRGRGMPHLHGNSKGDLYIRVHVDVPRKLDRKARKLVRKLAEHLGEDVSKLDKRLTDHF